MYTACTRPERPRAELRRVALGGHSGNFHRIGAIARYLEVVAPRRMAWLRRTIEDAGTLPLADADIEPLAFGTRTSCMTLPGMPRRVLKVLRPSMGCDARTATLMAREARDFYETLGRWYGDIPRLLPPTLHLVVHGPVRGAVAAVQIQALVPEGRDLLQDHTDDELVDLLVRHLRFHRDFRHFVLGTRHAWHEERRFLDMVGRGNVLLLPGPDGPELRVPDFGIWDLAWRRDERPDLYARAVRAVERLERVLERADAVRDEQDSRGSEAGVA